MVTLNGHFDGKAIILDEPLSTPIPTGTRLRVSIEPVGESATATVTPAPRRFQPLDLDVDPELSRAIGTDPEVNIENS